MIGALSTNAPPGETRSARGHAALDDRALIDAVRIGDLHAFGTLYERHVGAVRGLARRLCGNPIDADDVVGDVFTNTLRAIKSGRGPQDDLRPYVLTATRHTVIKLRTCRDSGRAVPTADEQLELPVTDTFEQVDDGVGAIGDAFVQLPDRFRNVLWLSCVEDLPPAEVGRRTELSAGAVSSLTLRARRALARSYLMSRISQPIVSADCVAIRDLLPAVVRDEAAAGTITRVDRHLAACCECREAFEEMQSLAGSLRTVPWFALVAAWLRSLGARVATEAFGGVGGATGLAPVVVTAVAVLTFAAGDAPAPPPSVPPSAVTMTTPVAPAVALPITSASSKPEAAADTPSVIDRVADAPARQPRPTTALRERDVPTPTVPAVLPLEQHRTETVAVDVDHVVGVDHVVDLASVAPVTEPVRTTVSTTLDAVDQLGRQVASTSEDLEGTTEQLLGDVDQVVVDVLQSAGAGELAATVEPVLDTTAELVTSGVVEPVTGRVADTTVEATALVTDTTGGLLGFNTRS